MENYEIDPTQDRALHDLAAEERRAVEFLQEQDLRRIFQGFIDADTSGEERPVAFTLDGMYHYQVTRGQYAVLMDKAPDHIKALNSPAATQGRHARYAGWHRPPSGYDPGLAFPADSASHALGRDDVHKEAPATRELLGPVLAALDKAYAKHGTEPWGRHEFYGILLEEVDELWDAIKADEPMEHVLREAAQIACVCLRYMQTGDRYRGVHPAAEKWAE